MESLEKKTYDVPSTSSMFFIEISIVYNNNLWILDTGCGSHICTNVKGLRNSRQLNKGKSILQVGNGARVVALAIGTYILTLPRGLILSLDDCYYVPALTKNIISISSLNKNGFHLRFSNNGCSIMLNDVFYAYGALCNGIYILDLSNPILFVHDNKRLKQDNVKPSYLWHSHLGHINERCMTKLQKSGILGSFDFESYDTCESCLLGKMTNLPFSEKGKLVNGLLDLIHLDLCGPISTHARGGFVYFNTFIDDHSRYGYLYIMKYKFEAFERFKEFIYEVEKQLGRSIRTLGSRWIVLKPRVSRLS